MKEKNARKWWVKFWKSNHDQLKMQLICIISYFIKMFLFTIQNCVANGLRHKEAESL